MRRITLPGTDIETSSLGFGCSGLMGCGDHSARQNILGRAFDSGITHFDTARLYGLGRAEGELGQFTSQRRDQVTVTTKFGFEPMSMPMVAVVRTLAKVRAKGLSEKIHDALVPGRTHLFTTAYARQALESSLTRLKTDYIDLYLLHDCNADDVKQPELLAFLQKAKAEGKIRAFGIGTNIEHVNAIDSSNPEFTKLVQFGNSAANRSIETLREDPSRAIVTHQALSSNFKDLKTWLAEHADQAQAWGAELGIDLLNPAILGEAMLAYAVSANPNGITLFSTTNIGHLEANVKSANQPILNGAQAARFAELVSGRTA